MLKYDVTYEKSFSIIPNWFKVVEQKGHNNCCTILVCAKSDRTDRIISEEEGKKLAEKLDIKYFETSAKTGENVNEVFAYLVKEILKIKSEKYK